MQINNIGQIIKIYRQKRNISQSNLAARLNLSTRQLAEIESGNSLSTIDTLSNIAQILNIPVDLLFKDCDKSFFIYAIDDYLNMINKENAKAILNNMLNLMEDKN